MFTAGLSAVFCSPSRAGTGVIPVAVNSRKTSGAPVSRATIRA